MMMASATIIRRLPISVVQCQERKTYIGSWDRELTMKIIKVLAQNVKKIGQKLPRLISFKITKSYKKITKAGTAGLGDESKGPTGLLDGIEFC